MTAPLRIALLTLILAAGLLGALLFPREEPDAPLSDGSDEVVLRHADEPRVPSAGRSTVLMPVEEQAGQSAPTASTRGSLPPASPLELDAAELRQPPKLPIGFDPGGSPPLPRLTDEPLPGGFLPRLSDSVRPRDSEPAPAESRYPPQEEPRRTDPLDDLQPVAPRPATAAPVVGSALEESPLRRHVVRDGDTLESLARRYLGDAGRYREIYDLNSTELANPEILPLGIELLLPPRESAAGFDPQVTPPPLTALDEEAEETSSDTPPGLQNPLRQADPPLVPLRPRHAD